MLTTLDEPSSSGPAMAMMMLTGLYALVLAGAWFLPIARRFA
jgi:flagellar motor component MotA